MRRMAVIALAAGVLTMATVGAAGCGHGSAPGAPPAGQAPAGQGPAAGKEAAIYVQILRRYLSTPTENSFPSQTFKTVYVLDKAYPDAADPAGTPGRRTPIAPSAQHQITAALAGAAHVVFVSGPDTVTETADGCARVRDGGILITLGAMNGGGSQMQVPVSGWVACLGATWLTYVVQDQPGTGWRVTGTTGWMGIS